MQRLTHLALRRPVTMFMLVLALLVFGMSSVFTTPLELIPDIEIPYLIVMTTYPGAAPEEVDSLVTAHISDASSTVSGVRNVHSTSAENISIVILQMEYGTNIDKAHTALQNNLDIYRSRLPDSAGRPTIIEMNMDMMPPIALSATAAGDVDPLNYITQEIKPQFEKIAGVASVTVSGGRSDYVGVRLREEELSSYGLSMNTVAQIVEHADFSIPAGSIAQGELELLLRGGISYPTVESLGDIPLTLSSGDIIHLSDIADVSLTSKRAQAISRLNGRENITISVSKVQSTSTLSVTNAVKATMKKLQNENAGLEFEVVYDASDLIRGAITSVLQSMALGVVFAMAILFLFFGDLRASLIVGTSIPLSMLTTLIAMSFMGYSFNIISLGGLVVGSGMMVDNSIVVLESCFRSRSQGLGYLDSVYEGVRVVASSVFASTMTTIVVFLPIAFLKGMSGQLFSQLGFTIVFSLLASLIFSLTVSPLLFYRLEPVEKKEIPASAAMSAIERAYARFLPRALKFKKTVILVSLALLIASFAIIPFVGMELIPANDEGTITLDVTARPGLSLKKLDELIAPLEAMVSEHPDLDHYTVASGGTGMQSLAGGASSSCVITAYLKKGRSQTTAFVIDEWRKEAASCIDCEIVIKSSSTTMAMAGSTSDIEINLQGTRFDDVKSGALQIEEFLRSSPHVLTTQSTVSSQKPQAEIAIDPVKAAAKGLVPASVMGDIYTMLEGKKVATLQRDGRDYDIVVEYSPERFAELSDLEGMFINSPTGTPIPLADIAAIEHTHSPQSITKKDSRYIVSVTAQLDSKAPDKTAQQTVSAARALVLPGGVEFTESAQSESQNEEFSTLFGAIATAVFLVFLTMAIQFESPRFSLVVMISIPFALIGSFLLLLIFRATLSLPALMGFLMLVGIVVNNAILFIDTTNLLRNEQGLSAEAALVKAGTLRMRPIFMTTLTTVLAMIPMAVGVGDNGEIMRGMALVIIGGLLASTVLTLLLLPTFYLMSYRKKSGPPLKTELAMQKSK